jgi:enoyl-CoA hydratase
MNDVVTWRTAAAGVWVVTLDRPPANALAPELLEGLDRAIAAATKSGDVKVMVLTSALDGFFAAGADIKHLGKIDADSFAAYGDQMRGVNDRLERAPWITIAAINGHALGGGLELALASTLRVASRKARLGLPEGNLGLIPGAGGTQRLPRLVGRGRALDIMLTARHVEGDEALAIGLVDRIVDHDVVEAALDLAYALAQGSLPTLLAVVRTVDAADQMSLPDGIRFEANQIAALFSDGEASEGISAFIEKRSPRFR